MAMLLLLGILCLLTGLVGGFHSLASRAIILRETTHGSVQPFSCLSESASSTPASKLPNAPFPRRSIRREDRSKSLFQPVPRPYTLDQRRSLSKIKVGEALQGRVISFANFGMYVDVGTVIDGLVHVQDASSTYFVEDLAQRFRSGQDITVWVKFVDPTAKKLGLQLFPSMERLERIYRWEDLQVRQPVEGKVIKFSQAGATVDIGGPCTAYLSRKAMKSNHRQRNLPPWDLLALNQTIQCFIFDIDKNHRVLDVTTYAPADWHRAFLQRRPGLSSRRASVPTTASSPDPHTPPPGSWEMAPPEVDIDADLPIGEESDGEAGQEGSWDIPLAGQALVLDDLAGRDHLPPSSSSTGEYIHPSRRTTVREVFHALSGGRAVLSLRELKLWGYVRDLREADLLSLDALRRLFLQAGAGRRFLTVRDFAVFLVALDKELEQSSPRDR